MTRVLLTGAGGFVGHHFLEHALENTDWEIVCLDSFRHRGKTSRIREVLDGRPDAGERVSVLTHDLRAPIDGQLAELIGEVDYLVSIASDSHVDRSIIEPRSFIENNVQLILTLLEYAREHPVEKFLHIGTDEQFGPAPVGREHSEEEPFRPSNPYCLPPETLICTTTGLTRIEDFDPWCDEAISRIRSTLSGRQRVVAKYQRQYSGSLIRIQTEHGEIRATPEHVFFRRGTGYAGEPMQWGGVWLPGRPHARVEEIPASEIVVGDSLMMVRKVPSPMGGGRNADAQLARFLGYFVGDGSYSPRTRYVRLADQSRERLEAYRRLLVGALGVSPKSASGSFGTIYKHGTKNCYYLQFASERLRSLIDLARPKADLAWTLADASDECIAEFVSGFMEAEAHYAYRSDRLVSVVAVQRCGETLKAVQFYLRRLGIVGQIRQGAIRITENASLARMLKLSVDKARSETVLAKPQHRKRAQRSLLWSRVADVQEEAYEGLVYDLEMAKESNFVADYFVVHNSSSKAMQADACYAYWRTYGLPIGVTQTMNIIGERQDPEKFVPLVLAKVLAGGTVSIHASSEGRPGSRFYLHARNQADALLFLLRSQPFLVYGEGEMGRWNVVGEREIDNLELGRMIARYAGQDLRFELVDWHAARPGHDLRYALDGTKMRDLGWTPPVPLAESLERTVHWTLQNRRWLLP